MNFCARQLLFHVCSIQELEPTVSVRLLELPSLRYSIQDVMMVLVSMQKEAQRREESFQRSLMKLKDKLQSQVSF